MNHFAPSIEFALREIAPDVADQVSLYAGALDLAESGLVVVDLERDAVALSHRACRLMGLDAETEWRPLEACLAAIHPDDRDAVRTSIGRLKQEGGNETCGYRVKAEDGKIRHAHVRCATLPDADGSPRWMLAAVRDVTEQTEQEAVRRDEVRYRTLVQSTWDIVFRIALDGTVTGLSPRAEEFVGALKGPATAETARTMLHPDDLQIAVEAWRTAKEINGPFDMEVRVRSTANGYRLLKVRLAPVCSASGEPLEWIGVAADITEQREAERQLRLTQERYRNLVESSVQGLVIVRRNGFIEYVNPSGAAVVGLTPQEATGRNIFEFVCAEDRERLRRDLRVNPERPGQCETRIAVPECGDRWIRYLANRLPGTESVLIAFFEITEQRRSAERLARNEERLRLAFEAGRLNEWEWDLLEDRVTWTDVPMTRDVAVHERHGDIFTRFLQHVHPDDRQRVSETVAKAIASGDSFHHEYRILRSDGSYDWLSSSARVHRNEAGQATRMVGVDMIVTETRTAQERLQRAARLESVGMLAGGIAHDFNNLLTGILGCAEFVEEDPNLNEKSREYLRRLRGAADRAAELTRQLQTFARQQPSEPKALDILEHLRSMAVLIQRALGSGIQYLEPADSRVWPALVDPVQFEQVILSLASNARDAMPHGGTFGIRVGAYTVEQGPEEQRLGLPAGDYVAIRASDSGRGMDPEALENLFQPFYSTKSVGKGSGLGLAASYGIITQSGGNIQVESKEGEGTAVTIYLPRARSTGSGVGLATAPPARRNVTILVVEDDPEVRQVLASSLRLAGYSLVEAASAADALHAMEVWEVECDLLIADVRLPGGSGVDLARRLAAMRPRLPVLLISGREEEAAERPANCRFLPKPFSTTTLLIWVREMLDNMKRGQPNLETGEIGV